VIFGIASSTGGSLLPGVGNYATVLYNNTATNLAFGTNQILRLSIDGTSGAATFSSSVTSAGLNSNGLTSLIGSTSTTGAIDPGVSEFISTGFNLNNSGSQDISTISLPSNTQWKAIITGAFANNFEGGGLVSPTFSRDIDGTNSTIAAGSTTITFSRNASTGKLQATNSNASARVTFVGTIHLVTFPQSAIPSNTRAFFGNVGIGTTSPGQTLEVKGADGTGIRLMNAGSGDKRWDIVGSGNDFRINETGVGAVVTIKAAGNVGIGTTSPNAKLEVNGNIYTTSTTNFILFGTNSAVNSYIQGGSDNSLFFGTGNASRFSIASTGAATFSSLGTGTVYSSSGTLTNTNPSDERLKNNINDISWGLSDILKLRPVSFNWKDDKISQGKQFGFIAQEVREVMPEAIKIFGEDVKYLGLEKDAIYATLVKAIQEQQSQIDILKQEIINLKTN
jgi:hypothetical protein